MRRIGVGSAAEDWDGELMAADGARGFSRGAVSIGTPSSSECVVALRLLATARGARRAKDVLAELDRHP